MNVHIGKKGRIILIALFAIIIGGAFSFQNNVFADDSEFYFFVDTGVPIESLEITEDTTVYIDGILGSDEVKWVVGDDTIITATNDTGDSGKYSLNIKCIRPGTTKISGTISRKIYNEVTGTTDIKYTSLTLSVTVKLKINNYTNTPNNLGKMYHLFDENEEDQGSLVLNVGDTFNLKLMVGEVHADDLSWYCDYDENTVNNIASVSDSGLVTALSPGIAKVSVNTYKVSSDNNQTVLQSDYIYVVVKPQYTDESGSVLTDLNIEDPETIYTNASISKNLTWVVVDTNTNEIIVDTYAGLTSDRVSITPNSKDGSLEIDCKAGYYQLRVYPVYPADSSLDLRTAEKYQVNELNITEYVSFNFPSEYVFVGNEFDLYKNSNVYNFDVFTLQALSCCDVDTDTAIFTFTEIGEANIKITANDSSLPIRDTDQDSSGQGKWFADFTVLSNSGTENKQTIKIGETYQCGVSSLPFTSTLTWESLDTSIATVSASGKVTGIAAGTTTVRGVELTGGGITKYHNWTIVVSPNVTATLDKTSLELAVGDNATITATYNPNNDEYIKVKWVISNTDEEIVKITTNPETPGYVTIEGVAAGTVTLVLQDQNSYQLAFCNITVKQPIQTITLDQTDVEKTLQSNSSLNQFTLTAKTTPSNPTDDTLVWTSSDTSVATVENGLVQYKKAGTTIIRVAPRYQSNSSTVYAECKLTVYQQLSSIKLSDTTLTANVGDSVKLSVASYSPTQYIKDADLVISWTSSNDTVVKVTTATGLTPKLQAVGPGTATITAKTTSGVTTSCKVTVYQYPTSIKVSTTKITLDVGSSYTPVVTLSPAVLTNSTVTWESTNTNYVTVDKAGKITAKAAGKSGESTAQVVATTANGLRAVINVTVVQRVEDLTLNYSKKTVTKDKSFTLKVTITPSNAEDSSVTYKSSDTSIATVSKTGVVKGVKGGSTLITVTSNDTGISKYCLVVVQEKVTTITLNKSSYIMGKGKSYTLKATVKSNYATNQKLKWSSSNKKVATVSSKGVVKAKGYGYATITVKATDGSGAKATCRIRVVRQATSISLNKSSAKMIVGRTLKLKATIKPKNATIKTVSWSSSDTSIAYVDSTGKVTALKEGTVKITAKTKDNSGKKAVCIITVEKEVPASSVTIVNKDITLVTGETETLNYITNPGKTTDSVKWYSDDSRIVSVNKSTGKVTAHRTGTANITVSTSSGKSYTTTVTVVGLSRTSITMEQYDTYTLKVINGKSVQWDALNTDIVRVSSSGKISARKKGTTYVTAIVNGRKISCKVTVKDIK